MPAAARHTPAQADSGLTLLELVICVAVLAVLGVMALPSLGAQLDRQRLRQAAQALAGDISEARYLAAQRGTTIHLLAREGAQWCWGVAVEGDCDCRGPAACALHQVHATDHPRVRLLNPLDLQLDPTGRVQAPASTTLESSNGERLQVQVSAQGRPRICSPGGNAPQLPAC